MKFNEKLAAKGRSREAMFCVKLPLDDLRPAVFAAVTNYADRRITGILKPVLQAERGVDDLIDFGRDEI